MGESEGHHTDSEGQPEEASSSQGRHRQQEYERGGSQRPRRRDRGARADAGFFGQGGGACRGEQTNPRIAFLFHRIS